MKYFLYALCLSLIILKLTNYIDWSWWYVTMPIYGLGVLWCILMILLYVLKSLNSNPIKRYNSFKINKSKFQTKLDDYMAKQQGNNEN